MSENELVQKYDHMVTFWAKHFQHKAPPRAKKLFQLGDLISYGQQGLLRGIRDFKPEIGTPLETHLSNKVRLSIIDGLRVICGRKFQKTKIAFDADLAEGGAIHRVVADERSDAVERARSTFARGAKTWRYARLDGRDKQILALAFRERMSVHQMGKLFRKADRDISDAEVNAWLVTAIEKLAKVKHQPIDVCCVDGCDGKHHRHGYCRSHYVCVGRNGSVVHKRMPSAPEGCKFDGCNNKHYARGLCITHWRIANEQKENKVVCIESGCEKAAVCKGYCNTHYINHHRQIHGRKPWRKEVVQETE